MTQKEPRMREDSTRNRVSSGELIRRGMLPDSRRLHGWQMVSSTGRSQRAAQLHMKNNLVAYLAISALLSLANWILLLLPNFLAERHWSSQEIGWAIGCFFLVNLIFQILSGSLAHRRGNLSTALAGAGLGFVGGLLYLGALWLTGMIFPARVFHAAGAAMVFAGAL